MTLGRLVLCWSDAQIREAQDFLMESVLIAADVETLPDLGLITVNGYTGLLDNGDKATFVFPFYLSKSNSSGSPSNLGKSLAVMERVNDSGIPFTFQNGAYDLFYYMRYGIPVKNYAYDSMTMFWSIFPELPKRLDFISSILLDDYVFWKGDRKSDDYTTYMEYNGKDCDRTLDNTIRLVELLSKDSRALLNFYHAHLRVILALGMSVRGMRSDEARLAEHGIKLAADADAALARLQYLVADSDFNPNSPKQKSDLLYGLLGARLRNAKGRFVAKLEDASTGAVPLRALKNDHPVFRRVVTGLLDAIEPAKQISNVIGFRRAEFKQGSGNIRVFTSYQGVGTTTTRLSSTETPVKIGGNLQNLRKTYRDFIVADPGCFILEVDLSAGDDVFVTFESGDPRKIELFRSGRDAHSQNATLFFPSWVYEQVVAGKKSHDPRVVHPITGIRQITKKLSHGCNYLMAALTLLMTAGRDAVVAAAKEVGFEDAGRWDQTRLGEFCTTRESLYRSFYTRFARSGSESWYSDLRAEHRYTGGFTTPFRYYQRFLGDWSDDNVLRGLAATAGQAGTAGRINSAMEELTFGTIDPEFRDAPNPSYAGEGNGLYVNQREHGISLRLQTHDSLTFNVDPKHPDVNEGLRRIYAVMSRPVIVRNKLTRGLEEFVVGTEYEAGLAWGEGLHVIPRGSDVASILAGLESEKGSH